ncbi:MAG TPA: carboxypeptidase-like regulatory domain-containing protein [Terriglobia bacterium]|nr:carboxypeptidase-like regulatory domain-containing protein [Terriglobia bacterium]
MTPGGIVRLCFMVGALLLAFPKSSLACTPPPGPPPPPTPLSQLYREFPAVLIARVVEIRPVITGTAVVKGVSVPVFTGTEVRLSVTQGLKGTVGTEFTVARAGTSCDPTFTLNDSYLLFSLWGSSTPPSVRFASFPLPEVTEALKYIDAVRSNRPQALLYGRVQRHDDGNPTSNWWSEQFTLQAEGNGTAFETQTLPSGLYHLSLPPGRYTVRLLRKGQPASKTEAVLLESGDEALMSFDSTPLVR